MSMPGSLGLVDDGPYAACRRCGCSLRWDECEPDYPLCMDCLVTVRDDDEDDEDDDLGNDALELYEYDDEGEEGGR